MSTRHRATAVHWAAVRRAVAPGTAAALLVAVAAACGMGRPAPAATSTPAGTADAAPSAVSAARVSPVPTSASPSPAAQRPPDAWLAAEGGDPVAGQLGSYTWGGGGSDSPWLPGTPVRVGAGEPLTVTLTGDALVETWTVRLAPADVTDGTGARPIGDGRDRIAFPGPDAGAWTVQVSVRFVGGGSATYAWRVEAT